MKRSKRLSALMLALVLFTAWALSCGICCAACFEHNCTGIACPVCEIVRSAMHGFGPALHAASLTVACILLLIADRSICAHVCTPTLTSLKVRMND